MTVFSGTPPASAFYRNESFIVPDAIRPLAYNIEANRVTAIRLDGAFPEVRSWEARFENPKHRVHPGPAIGGKVAVVAAAATLGRKLIIFYRGQFNVSDTLYRAEIPVSTPILGRRRHRD